MSSWKDGIHDIHEIHEPHETQGNSWHSWNSRSLWISQIHTIHESRKNLKRVNFMTSMIYKVHEPHEIHKTRNGWQWWNSWNSCKITEHIKGMKLTVPYENHERHENWWRWWTWERFMKLMRLDDVYEHRWKLSAINEFPANHAVQGNSGKFTKFMNFMNLRRRPLHTNVTSWCNMLFGPTLPFYRSNTIIWGETCRRMAWWKPPSISNLENHRGVSTSPTSAIVLPARWEPTINAPFSGRPGQNAHECGPNNLAPPVANPRKRMPVGKAILPRNITTVKTQKDTLVVELRGKTAGPPPQDNARRQASKRWVKK